jgi:hypothetical protein
MKSKIFIDFIKLFLGFLLMMEYWLPLESLENGQNIIQWFSGMGQKWYSIVTPDHSKIGEVSPLSISATSWILLRTLNKENSS